MMVDPNVLAKAGEDRDHFIQQYAVVKRQLEDMTKERDAYRKAKQENDERFMLERDAARRERDEALAEVQRLRDQQVEYDPYGEAVERRVIWDDDCPVDQERFNKLLAELHQLKEAHAELQWAPQPDGLPPPDPCVVSGQEYHRLREALRPLLRIAEAYEANALDDEARRFWGKDDEHECQTPADDLELYSGRGGKRLLTLGDCFRAREVAGG